MSSDRQLRQKIPVDWKKLHYGEPIQLRKRSVCAPRQVLDGTFDVERLIWRRSSEYQFLRPNNIGELNFQLQKFKIENLELELKCRDLLNNLAAEIHDKQKLEKQNTSLNENIKDSKTQNAKLKDYIKQLQKHVVTPNAGKQFHEIENNKSRKLKEIKTKAGAALWFAESYGLVPTALKLKNVNDHNEITVNFGPEKYKDMDDSDKRKLKELMYILDRFGVSDNAYHELTQHCGDLERKYLITECRNDINSLFHFERTAGNIPGAFVSFKAELARYIKANNPSCNPRKFRLKLSGDGSKVSRISNFIVLSFSDIDNDTVLSSHDQNTFCIINCSEKYENLHAACPQLFSEINDILETGEIHVDGVPYSIELFFGGDMKFLQICLGLGNSLSNYCCPWCRIHKDDRDNMTRPHNFYHETEQARTSENLQQDFLTSGFGVKFKPLLKFQPDHVIPDELHVLLRICDILLRNLIDDTKSLDDKNKVLGVKSNYLDDLVTKIRDCGVSFNIWVQKGTNEIDWSSLTGSDYKKILKNLPHNLFFLINHDTHDSTVHLWQDFYKLYLYITQEINELSTWPQIFEKCKLWVSNFLELGKSRRGYNNVTPYMHCLVYHIPFFTQKYGKLLKFSGQGVEKLNDDIKQIHQSKTNRYDATLDALKVRKRVEHLRSEGCARGKRPYDKKSDYWDNGIFLQRSAKKRKISQEMSLVAEQFQTATNSIGDLSISDIKQKLLSLGIKTRVKKREKLLDLLKKHELQR